MQPRTANAKLFREYIWQRWQAGYRNGSMLLGEIQALGCIGTYKTVAKVLSTWRLGNLAFERPDPLPTFPSNAPAPEAAAPSSSPPAPYSQTEPNVRSPHK